MKSELLKLLKLHLQGEVAKHKANLTVYFDNPAGIGEHPDILGAIDMEVERMAGVRDKIETLRSEWDFDED